MKKIIALTIMTTIIATSNIVAYQTAKDAIQVTFKSGHNLVVDMESGIKIFK